jgi:hypothetical protein
VILSHDEEITIEEVRRIAPEDVEGWKRMEELCSRYL